MKTSVNKTKTRFNMMIMVILGIYTIYAMGCLVMESTSSCDEYGCDGDHDGYPHYDDDDDRDEDVEPPVRDCPDSTIVCGADGETYASKCDASRAHTPVYHEGECGPSCATQSDCALGEDCGTPGRCEPVICEAVTSPVCGEDGNTYDNACEAKAAHQDVIHDGSCVPECTKDADCGAGDLCNEQGSCEVARCPNLASDDTSQEVCAEDGFTYQTQCHARLSRLAVIHEGCCF